MVQELRQNEVSIFSEGKPEIFLKLGRILSETENLCYSHYSNNIRLQSCFSVITMSWRRSL